MAIAATPSRLLHLGNSRRTTSLERYDSQRPSGRLTVATWNIHYGIGTDRRMDLERIASVLNRIGADVIGLQEVGWHRPDHPQVDQFAYLRAHTGYDVIEGLVRDPLRSHFGNAVLTRLPVLRKDWIDLKVRGHAPRAALITDLGVDRGIDLGIDPVSIAAGGTRRRACAWW